MIVTERFFLNNLIKRSLRQRKERFGFGLLGLATYYRTYSRIMHNGRQERWADTVIRCVEGVLSIRKTWYVQHNILWDEELWQAEGIRLANAIFNMHFLPSGRNLWANGSDFVYERGGLALNNCQFVDLVDPVNDPAHIMNSLMHGVGLGFGADNLSLVLKETNPNSELMVIPDSREGWVDSLSSLIRARINGAPTPVFDYSLIRAAGEPIRGFGGTSGGPEPLRKLHERTEKYLDAFHEGTISTTRFAADLINAIGACVVAGNVRRSAELYLGSPNNDEFLDLKNYKKHPERQEIGWMSNNSIKLTDHDDFLRIPELTERIIDNGEPGFVNFLNVSKYGRYGEPISDTATGTNPCSEATLESYELCCLVEVFPNRCKKETEFYEAVRLATLYASTVSLLETQQPLINEVVERNHRIGVSVSGVADWFDNVPATTVIKLLRRGYRVVEQENRRLAYEAGVPESIRKTVVKPSGTVSLLAGASPGMHYPPFTSYIRRIRVGEDAPIVPLLASAGVPYEHDVYSDNTLVFEFPVRSEAKRSQRELTIWQKGAMLSLLQMHWADQMVSNTITFSKDEEGQLLDFIAMTLPTNKSMSLLPDRDEGAYAQMPYEAIDDKEYEKRLACISEVDWSAFEGSDGADSRFCENDVCLV
jgi:ribonucleoside-triphosphate reductase